MCGSSKTIGTKRCSRREPVRGYKKLDWGEEKKTTLEIQQELHENIHMQEWPSPSPDLYREQEIVLTDALHPVCLNRCYSGANNGQIFCVD